MFSILSCCRSFSCAFWPDFWFDRRSDRPIAIAYQPTEPNPSHLADVYRPTPAHSTPVFVNAVNDESLNGNQQFQAPFIPSLNLENTQSTHNGWSIVTPPSVPSGPQTESKNNQNHRISSSLVNANANVNANTNGNGNGNVNANSTSISRSDSEETAESEQSGEITTKRFDFDNFKPDLQGGFMPIYKNNNAASAERETEAPKIQSDEKSDRSDFSLGSLFYDDDEEN